MNLELIEKMASEFNIDANNLRKAIENEIEKVERKNSFNKLKTELERLTSLFKNQYLVLNDGSEYIRIKKIYNECDDICIFGEGISAYDSEYSWMFCYYKNMCRCISDSFNMTKYNVKEFENIIRSHIICEAEVKEAIKQAFGANNEYLNNRLFNDSFEPVFEE